jgi:2-oxo-4-hydroxy-4-carboxy-5-ureidoimidazoline decarboxylase
MNLSVLNSADQAAFVKAVGWVFEGSPWIAERAWVRRPFATVDELNSAMADVIAEASPDEQLALLRAHPDLGSRARMTEVSSSEQAGAGLNALTPLEFDHLNRLNDAYRARFGFPFLYAVRSSTKQDILGALEARLHSTPDAEFQEALRQACRIARFRLNGI